MTVSLIELQELLADTFQVPLESIMPDLALGGLPQWDSMGHMGLMLALEARFGVDINADTIGALTSLPAIQTHLKENN